MKESPRWKFIEEGDNFTLLIFEVAPEDAGQYACVAINDVGKSTCTARLDIENEREAELHGKKVHVEIVQQKPILTRSLQPYTVFIPGKPAQLEVELAPQPKSRTTWFVNGREILQSERRKIIKRGNSTILILFNTTEDDQGEYLLKADNEFGTTTCKTTLILKGRLLASFHCQISIILKMIGKFSKNLCLIESEPPSEVTWYVNGVEIKPSPRYDIRIEEGKTILFIMDVGPEDVGEYTCKTVTDQGEAITSPTTVLVTPPDFVEPLHSTTATDGQEIRLTCKVTGFPPPQISWFHDRENIDDDEEYVISYEPETGEISLIIVEVFPDDKGQYACIAQNPGGQATTSATLSV
ncbi:hypothetical protein LOTGIDRAFT_141499, partial [Lottia gigantea]